MFINRRKTIIISLMLIIIMSLCVPAMAGEQGTVTVAKGDTLYTIAREFGTTVKDLKSLNGLKSDTIKLGQVIKVPSKDSAPADSDITGHWAEGQMKSWQAKGLIKGYADGTLRPNNDITRAEFITLVNQAFGFTTAAKHSFKDVLAGDWFAAEVAKAKAVGYISGYADGTLKPNNKISRQEVAAIVARILSLETSPGFEAIKDLKDASAIPEWSKTAISAVITNGYVKGYPDKTFQPTRATSRAETVTILNNALGILFNTAGTQGPAEGTQVIDGNATVTVTGVTLKNMIINGDLYLTEGVGDGDVILDTVTVKGKTLIKGGGAHSVKANNCTLGAVEVNRSGVRVVATGSTRAASVNVHTQATLEAPANTTPAFTTVTITTNLPAQGLVNFTGSFGNVQVAAPNAAVTITGGTVANMVLSNGASGTTVNIASGAAVTNITLNAAANVTGTGIIGTANINVPGTTIAPTPTSVVTAPNVGTTTPPSTGGGSSNVRVSAITVTSAGNVTEVTYGETLQMSATVLPNNATNKTIAWTVTPGTGTATISADGLLSGTGVGTVTVTATNAASGVTGTKVITVNNDIVEALQDAKDAEALLTSTDYADYSAVTAALALPETTNAEMVLKTTAINDAIAGLEFAGQADLDTALAAEALLTSTDYVDYSDVTTALAMPETTNAEVVAKTTALNIAIAALVTVVDADLQAAKDAEALLTSTDYADYSAVTTALAMPETNDAEKIAKTTAINDAIAGLVLEAELLSVDYDNVALAVYDDDTLTLNFDRDITVIGVAADYEVMYSDTGAFGGEEITLTETTDYTVADGAGNTVVITLTTDGNASLLTSTGYFRVTILTIANLTPIVDDANKTATTGLVDIDQAD